MKKEPTTKRENAKQNTSDNINSKTMKFICPLIVVSDMERSRKFYRELLDQKIKYDFGENVTFEGDFAIHLDTHFQSLINQKPILQEGHNFELYFEYDDMESAVKKLQDAGVEFVHEMREQPWRQRVVRLYDPDRHIIEIGESMEHLSYRLHKEGLSPDNISTITMLPLEFVTDSIQKFRKE